MRSRRRCASAGSTARCAGSTQTASSSCSRRAGPTVSGRSRTRHVSSRLQQAGLMRPAGQAAIDRAKANGSWQILDDVEALVMPDDLSSALDVASADRILRRAHTGNTQAGALLDRERQAPGDSSEPDRPNGLGRPRGARTALAGLLAVARASGLRRIHRIVGGPTELAEARTVSGGHRYAYAGAHHERFS